MIKLLKINKALLLSVVAAFVILFLHITTNPALTYQPNNDSIQSHFSQAIKVGIHFESANNSENVEYSSIEIFEEDSNDDDKFKANTLLLALNIYSLLATKINLNTINPFDGCFSYNLSCRYLVFQVFRI